MPLLQSSSKIERASLRISVEKSTLDRAKQYCEFARIENIDEFFEKAAEFVMKRDTEWRKHSDASSE